MNRKDWLLLAIGDAIEPIQLQKTLFKFVMEADVPIAQRYRFEPYNWGPCAKQIYPDMAELRAAGLVEFEPMIGGWNAYKLTPNGHKRAAKLRASAPKDLTKALTEQRQWVISRGFRRLLHDVYEQYPKFAERSLFQG